ncbi:hypothetical protein LTR36_006699 [Oleoguttula mirabilis]|uniref:DUF1682-domain-containing protein n=1 Tax=Oleoguttula mirabilis TaxID=1507867 RepID=A0AAV9JC04_9PEZI|nr:hypothetical protein LTR36_006699 [Oleoguttula mirabilis]
MAEYLQQFFGGAKSSVTSVASDVDADFADFATAASPVAPSHAATLSSAAAAAAATGTAGISNVHLSAAGRPFTKWYRVWERVTIADFYQELVILPCLLVVILVNLWGSRANRHRAKQWAATHLPMLESEFASIGFGGGKPSPKLTDAQTSGLAKKVAGSTDVPEEMLREKSKGEYITYATGRQNVAWLDVKLTLYPRYNPFKWLFDVLAAFFIESMPAPTERVEATIYCFDGKEKTLISSQAQSAAGPGSRDSTYDGFVWAVVHKDKMKQLRDDRYDVSLTTTKDHPKLPAWATVMSESAEVTEALLTADLVKAITDAGEDLEALIVTDQPIDAPKKLNDTLPKKRISLSMRLNPQPASTSLFAAFLRLPDHLVSTAHFRPEALRKIRSTRDEAQARIRKVDEDEKAEERKTVGDKAKKEEREKRLSGMTSGEQKKFLEKEKEKEARKSAKKRTTRS